MKIILFNYFIFLNFFFLFYFSRLLFFFILNDVTTSSFLLSQSGKKLLPPRICPFFDIVITHTDKQNVSDFEEDL